MAGGGAWTTPKNWTSAVLASTEMDTYVSGNDTALTQATSTITTTGTQTALSIPVGRGDLVLIANNASLLTLQGIAAGQAGQRLTIMSVGAGQVALTHQSGSASAANRLVNFATSGLTMLAAGSGVASYIYDDNASRWHLVEHDQGAWITPTFAAGSYTANGSQTWTLAAGDVTTQAYCLRGRMLMVSFELVATSVGGTPNTQLLIGNAAWGGFTAAKAILNPIWLSDNGSIAIGICAVTASSTTIACSLVSLGNWAAATNTTNVLGQIVFEVT